MLWKPLPGSWRARVLKLKKSGELHGIDEGHGYAGLVSGLGDVVAG